MVNLPQGFRGRLSTFWGANRPQVLGATFHLFFGSTFRLFLGQPSTRFWGLTFNFLGANRPQVLGAIFHLFLGSTFHLLWGGQPSTFLGQPSIYFYIKFLFLLSEPTFQLFLATLCELYPSYLWCCFRYRFRRVRSTSRLTGNKLCFCWRSHCLWSKVSV